VFTQKVSESNKLSFPKKTRGALEIPACRQRQAFAGMTTSISMPFNEESLASIQQ
jgi:hypothetical protein